MRSTQQDNQPAGNNVVRVKLSSMLLAMLVCMPSGAKAAPINDAPAPEFSGKTMTGAEISLSDFKGRPVVLEWTNHQCPYVRKHYNSGNMQKTQRALTEGGAVWISVISSAPGRQGYVTADQAQALTASRGAYANHVILDPLGGIGRLYEAKTTPHMFLIDEAGILRYQGAIDDIPSANPRSLSDAENLLLAAWQELRAGEAVSRAQTKPYGCTVKYSDAEG